MKIDMKVDIDSKLVKMFDPDVLEKEIQKELKISIQDAERIAKEIVPKRTGALGGSIHHGGSRLSWWAKTQLDYSDYIEEGTRAHVITGSPWLMSAPNNPQPLEAPRHTVFHPGNPAYKYMETALYMATEDLEERIVKVFEI